MQRICPVCHENLTANDHYFCGNCGGILESSLISKIDSSKKEIDLDKIGQKKALKTSKFSTLAMDVVKFTNIKGLIILLGILAFVGIPLYVFMTDLHNNLQYMMSATTSPKSTAKTLIPLKNSETTSTPVPVTLPLISDMLGDKDLIKFIPYYTDIFIESADSLSLFKMLATDDNFYNELYESLAPHLSGPSVGAYTIRSDGNFWIIVLKKKDVNTEKYTIPSKYTWIYSKESNDKIILSNNQNLISSVIASGNNLERNINLNPLFVSYRNRLSVTAKLAVVTLTGEGKKIVASQIPNEIPNSIKQILEEAFNKENNFLVIR